MKSFLIASALITTLFNNSAQAASVFAPVALNPGSYLSSLPDGGSTGGGPSPTKLFDETLTFSYASNLSGKLRERVLSYPDAPSDDHPGLYFDYEISLTSGSVAAFTLTGYTGFQTFVKQCGISTCGGSGANGKITTSAGRSTSGDQITFYFDNPLLAGEHSANLQIFVLASSFVDPPAYFTDINGNSFSIDVVAPSVPELHTWALLILGLAGLGHIRLRRQGCRNASLSAAITRPLFREA